MHHDHNYFKNAKRPKSFYNLNKIYTDTMNKNYKSKINRVIKFYDSIKNFGLSLNGHCVCEDVRRFLRSTNFFSNIAACQWQLEYPETPQQQDSSSCGVFACQIAKQLSRSQSIKIKTSDISYLRKEMTCEIAFGILF